MPDLRQRPLIAITMGDPGGIGPEIIVRSLCPAAGRAADTDVFVFGSWSVLDRAAERAGLGRLPAHFGRADPADVADGSFRPGAPVTVVDFGDVPPLHAPSAENGRASLAYLGAAVESALRPRQGGGDRSPGALVTAPISKTSWRLAGFTHHPGHTELLHERFGSSRTAMMFVGPALRIALVTIHVPLARVPEAVTTGGVCDTIELAAAACGRLEPARRPPRIAVCGLNPHAGEGGILGEEDARVIRPAVERARSRGVDAHGPLPADTVFRRALRTERREGDGFDAVVAMYHDQGLIPSKLVDGDLAVNLTVGLPDPHAAESRSDVSRFFPRTSPAHGTAYDIAHLGVARETSMSAAIDLAVSLSI